MLRSRAKIPFCLRLHSWQALFPTSPPVPGRVAVLNRHLLNNFLTAAAFALL